MKKILSVILVIVILLVVGCSASTNDTNTDSEVVQGEFKIKVGLVTPEQDIATRSMRYFEEKVETMSEGRIDVELFPGGALGGSADIFNGIQDGSIEMGVNIYPPFAQFSDAFLIYNMLFIIY